MTSSMICRDLGKTGVQVSEVGMGCNRLGQDYAPDEHWVRLVQRAADLGVTVFDLAEAYALRSLAAQYEGGMTRMAHHFALTPRAISAIIPGARTVEQLEENVAASNGVGLPPQMREQIERVRATWS